MISEMFDSHSPEINMKVCQHPVHKLCFNKKYGNQHYFPCPLCKNVFNAILPVKYKKDSVEWQIRI